MKDPTLRQRATFCRRAARSSADRDLARALHELADDYERVAFDGIGPEDSLLAGTTPHPRIDLPANEREDSALSNQETIYLIDDNDFLRDALRELLESEGFHVLDFACANAFLRQPRKIGFGCIVTDIQMPGMNGLELIEKVRVHDKAVPIIAITAHPNAAVLEAIEAADAILLVKPFGLKQLIAVIVDSWGGRLH
jgi:CheY-like chemotaxis protein